VSGEPPAEPDALLAEFLAAADEEASRPALARLLEEVARPLLGRVLSRQLGGRNSGIEPADVEDLLSATLLKLHLHLIAVRSGDHAPPASFADYVAVAGFNAVSGFFMARQPERTRLRDRVRYVLRREERLASWSGADRDTVCGLARHRGRPAAERPERLDGIVAAAVTREGAGWGRFPALVSRILVELAAPCRLEELVDALATTLGVDERPAGLTPVRDATGPKTKARPLAAVGRTALERIEATEKVGLLWEEIRELPENQRFALLVNLRGEGDEAPLEQFLLSGVVGAGELAGALGLTPPELAALLPTLPRDDAWIAERLGLTRQQVINLRKSARLRLARRLRDSFDRLG